MQQCLFSWQIIRFIVEHNGLISSTDQTQACVPLREAIRRWKVMAFCGEVRGSANLKERRLSFFGQHTSFFFNSKAMWATFPHPQGINLVYLEPSQSSDLRKRTSSALSEVKQTCLGRFWPACVRHASCAETTSKPPSPSVTTADQGWVNSLVFLCWQGTYMHLKFGHPSPSTGLSLFKNTIASFFVLFLQLETVNSPFAFWDPGSHSNWLEVRKTAQCSVTVLDLIELMKTRTFILKENPLLQNLCVLNYNIENASLCYSFFLFFLPFLYIYI